MIRKSLVLLTLLIHILLLNNIIFAQNEVRLIPSDDAYVIADLSDQVDVSGLKQTNTGLDEFIHLISAWNMTENQNTIVSVAYLKFDLSEFNIESIRKVTLNMFASDVELDNNPQNIALIFVDDDNWNESEITYLQRPFFSTTIDAISVISESSKWYSWDITEIVKKNKNSKISLALTFETGKDFTSDLATFYSKETIIKENVPYIAIEFVVNEQPANYALAIIGGVVITAIVAIVLKYSKKIRK